MEMQRIESEFEICIFGFFFYFFSDDLRYARLVVLFSIFSVSRSALDISVLTFFVYGLIARVCDYFFTSLLLFSTCSFLSDSFVGFRPSFDSVCELYVLFSRCVKRFV